MAERIVFADLKRKDERLARLLLKAIATEPDAAHRIAAAMGDDGAIDVSLRLNGFDVSFSAAFEEMLAAYDADVAQAATQMVREKAGRLLDAFIAEFGDAG